jgi:Flp pilus assembly protein TadG
MSVRRLRAVQRQLAYGVSVLGRSQRGSVLVLFAVCLVPMLLAVGIGIDYARAVRMRSKLQNVADAAALFPVNKQGMALPRADAERYAQTLFMEQIGALEQQGLILDTANRAQFLAEVRDINDKVFVRESTVTFSARSRNIFAGLLGLHSLAIKGQAAAASSAAPNTDIHVLVDTSPSMLMAATMSGIAAMKNATRSREECAFACHETSEQDDNYKIARQNGITLRFDLVRESLRQLVDTADATARSNNATYRMALYSFDYEFRSVWPRTSSPGEPLDADLARFKSHVPDATVLTVCRNGQRVCGVDNDNMVTNFTAALDGVNQRIPYPGKGSALPGDQPAAILFLITDGMRDEDVGGERKLGPIPAHLCDGIKSKGIQIAILNTKYLPEAATGWWSESNVRDPYLQPTNRVVPPLQQCASPGLYHEVLADDDIARSLSELFVKSVSRAHLLN